MACGVYQYTAKAGCKREKPPSKSIYPPGKESISDLWKRKIIFKSVLGRDIF